MKKSVLIIAACSLLLVQCFVSTRSTNFLAGTRESQVTMPDGINNMQVLNRTRPTKNRLLSGQGSTFTNRPGVGETLAGFRNEIKNRKYFSIGFTNKTAQAEQSINFPAPLGLDEINGFFQGDFILASLEVFQVDELQSFETERKMQLDPQGKEYYINIVRGTKTLRSTSGWRLYNSKTGAVVDEMILEHDHVYDVEGVDRANAVAKLEARVEQAYKDLGNLLGFMYAERVSPVSTYISRLYYAKSKSCPELKQGADFVRSKDWETAKAIWEDGLALTSNPKDVAKLHNNLGVYYEREGDLDQAIEQLELAVQSDSKIGSSYLAKLKSVKRSGYPLSVQ